MKVGLCKFQVLQAPLAAIMSSAKSECKECHELDLFGNDDPKKDTKKISKRGWLILSVSGVAFGTFYAVATPFVMPALRKICLPYVPATSKQVRNVIKLLKSSSCSTASAKKVIDVAKQGYQAAGVELNPWLVMYSKWNSWRENVHRHTQFYRSDLWKMNLSGYGHVVIFGVEQMMPDLEKKLAKELNDKGYVIACRFPLPTWRPIQTIDEGIDTVWLYEKPNR
ncbi:ATP synthase subunit C lysine N-methyltransferase-like isoform X2 [Tubulanus polymorphus]|uniref:ATP synthase subunit C lysine N-methyltransferase-like isoform X2 n=1 Tax=Tubulanus polymorphus TaxID=672921 RepID=UPI003DA42129